MEVDDDILARVFSFDLQFKGSKRTKFYRELFGYESKVVREDEAGREKVYENFYPGILTPLPHLRLGKSVIAVPKSTEGKMEDFFVDPEWDGIDLYTFDGILSPEDRLTAMEEALGRIETGDGRKLDEEIEYLLPLAREGGLDRRDIQRARIVVEKIRELLKHDWSDHSEFSSYLEEKIEPLMDRV